MQCIRVQKHIQNEKCDILPFSTRLTEVFNSNRVKNRPFLLTDCCCCLHTPTTMGNEIKISLANLAIFKSK